MAHTHKCCHKQKLKRGLWSPDEDEKLLAHIKEHGPGSWSAVPALAGIQRCGKSCRLRWINYLRPDLKRGSFSAMEQKLITELHAVYGNKWSKIASHLPGRTDNEVKNVWNSCLRKRVVRKLSSAMCTSTKEANSTVAAATCVEEAGIKTASSHKTTHRPIFPFHINFELEPNVDASLTSSNYESLTTRVASSNQGLVDIPGQWQQYIAYDQSVLIGDRKQAMVNESSNSSTQSFNDAGALQDTIAMVEPSLSNVLDGQWQNYRHEGDLEPCRQPIIDQTKANNYNRLPLQSAKSTDCYNNSLASAHHAPQLHDDFHLASNILLHQYPGPTIILSPSATCSNDYPNLGHLGPPTSQSASATCSSDACTNFPSLLDYQDLNFWFEEVSAGYEL